MNSIAPSSHRLGAFHSRTQFNLMLSSNLSTAIHSFPRRPLLCTSTPFAKDSKFTPRIQSFAPLTHRFRTSDLHYRSSPKVIFHGNPLFVSWVLFFYAISWLFLLWFIVMIIHCRSGKFLALGMRNFLLEKQMNSPGRIFLVKNCRNLKLKSQIPRTGIWFHSSPR